MLNQQLFCIDMILHHYKVSPFSEKIRAMFGYTDFSWQSAISPAMPPRAIVDPLAGGYRKIPIAQVGADIFCDTRIICAELAALTEKPELDVNLCAADIQEFVKQVDGPIFMAIAASGTPVHMMKMVLSNFMPWTAYALIKDRAQMSKNMKIARLSPRKAKPMVDDFVADIENRLQTSNFIFGDKPTIADFSAFHLIWFAKKTQGDGFISSAAKLNNWYERISAFGHGKVTTISKRDVFKHARDMQPQEIPKSMQSDAILGSTVSIQPNDYATDAVQGTLVGSDELRWVLLRETADLGSLHVHFPKQGFDLAAV